MTPTPLTLASYPKAVLHIDGDAFFTSVEQSINPHLKGKPLVTGLERGIIACASYEAKAMGIKRGIPLFAAKKICPNLVILPDDYETYGLYSRRMFNIIRAFTPMVEEYSIDEAFADITGMRRVFNTSYEGIAQMIRKRIHDELDITVSAGLSLSKTLAKLCSKFRKPDGFTAVPGHFIHILLQRTPLEYVWGFGPNTVNLLRKSGLATAYDFAMKSEAWAGKFLHKPGREIWNELRGNPAWDVNDEEQAPKGSIVRSKTFIPATTDRYFIYAKLVRNMEAAFMKARRHKLKAGSIGIVLRRRDFQHEGLEARLSRPTSSTIEAMPLVREMFEGVFRQGSEYRATLVALGRLENDYADQYDLFEDRPAIEKIRQTTAAVDLVNGKFGRNAVTLATSLFLNNPRHDDRDAQPARKTNLMPGETTRRRLKIPRLNITL